MTLERLAADIAALRVDGHESGDPKIALLANLMAARFTLMLDQFAEQTGALNGEMPWLASFRSPPTSP
jgi:hypothetical protein